jgi:hypothetical protein
MKKIKNETLIGEYFEAKNKALFYKKRQDDLKAQVLKLLGADTSAVSDSFLVEVKVRVTRRFDSIAFKSVDPQLWEKYTKESESVILNVDLKEVE